MASAVYWNVTEHREKERVGKLVFYAQSTGKRREGDRG